MTAHDAVPFRATYRVQLHAGFTFKDATAIVDYLAALGFSHLYCSPIMKARPGSTHGYDIVDHNSLNPEIGTEADFLALVEALHDQQMGILLDIVPNHMAVGPDNEWWLDILEWGQLSPYAGFFDINWDTMRRNLEGKVLLPVLGDQFGVVLEKGEIELKLDAEAGAFFADYYGYRLPISPFNYRAILDVASGGLSGLERERLAACSAAFAELNGLRSNPSRVRELAGLAKTQLGLALGESQAIAVAVAASVSSFAGKIGERASWFALGGLLDQQAYRLAYWRVASDEINYRRFFNINDLGGLRIEQLGLFEETHRRTFRMVEDGQVDGLRIDHIDGLLNPREYLERVQARIGRPGRAGYVVVEKILAHYEQLPEDWPVAGTTGYEAINLLGGLFVDPDGERALSAFYRRFTSRRLPFDEILYESKKRILAVNLASEVSVLAAELHRLSASHWRSRDFTLDSMKAAIQEVIAYFPVYRTYVDWDGARQSDRRFIDWAVGVAKKRAVQADTSILGFIHQVLTGDLADGDEYQREDVLFLAMRFQQLSGPVMAKGLEDTSFYRYFRLIGLNEVGGDPRRFSVSLAAFHRENEERLKRWPLSIIGGSTHDTKRGEDGRARLACLSGIAAEWAQRVRNWERFNRRFKIELDEAPAPDRNDEYYFYQTLLAAWPLELEPDDVAGLADLADRLCEALIKAAREGKEKSSWANPVEAYEKAYTDFARRALDASRQNLFLNDFHAFLQKVARFGAFDAVSLTVLRLTVPGVPDTYRGAELWDFSMVDPDNRRPVDYAAYRQRLDALRRSGPISPEAARLLVRDWRDGGVKLAVLYRLLEARKENPRLFAEGSYRAMAVAGGRADSVVAFIREIDSVELIVLVPRFWPQLLWQDGEPADLQDSAIELPAGSYRDLFTGRIWSGKATHLLQDLLQDFPVSALLKQ